MKIIIFFLLFCFLFFKNYAQQNSTNSNGFLSTLNRIKHNSQVYHNGDDSIKRVWGEKLKFQIVSHSGDTTFIRFNYVRDNSLMITLPNYSTYINELNINDLFYFVKNNRELFKYKFNGITWGLLIAPIKIRPKIEFEGNKIPLKLTTNITIGPYFGYKTGSTTWANSELNTISHSFIVFASPYTSFAEINASNSKDTTKSSTTAAAFSFGGGYLFEITKKFQIGALIGWDYVGGDLGEKWHYQGKAWFSFSIGFNFTK